MTDATATKPTAQPKTPLLELKGVSKSFGAVRALTDVDFEVGTGEVVALVGDNGAGKSTLIKAISGIQPGDRYSARSARSPTLTSRWEQARQLPWWATTAPASPP